MKVVKWADIIAECGTYKAGFVATFQKYEGMPTDAVVRGKVVMVTQKSFADRNGIDRATFMRWVKTATDAVYASKDAKQQRTAASHHRVAVNLARKSPHEIADAIEEAGPKALDAVIGQLQQRQVGVKKQPMTTADRKAREAQIDRATDGIKVASLDMTVTTMAAMLDEMHDDLTSAISKGIVKSKALEAIEKAAKRLYETAAAGKVFVS